MASRFGFASLIPPGLEIDSVDSGENTLIVTARSDAAGAFCPLCGVVSHRVQSHYVRQPSDLPCAGRRVRLRILVRRFRCGVVGCLREVFAERFDTTVLAERARRTGHLEEIVHHLGLALGGRPGAGFAQRLMLPVSNDTLLRVVRRRAMPRTEKLAVIGIDDWAKLAKVPAAKPLECQRRASAVIIATGQSSATWNADVSWRCCPTGNKQPQKHGCASIPGSASCRVIAVAAMARLSPERCPMPFRSPIDGT
jgi:hypothetical protein